MREVHVSDRSTIEWTEATWNPTTGCDQLSPGCDNCYALTLAKRLKAMGNQKYQGDGDPQSSGPGFALTVHTDELTLPHSWKSPRVIFVNSMSDLFHPDVPDQFIETVFKVMAGTPRHTYQVLTKRSQRLVKLAARLPWPGNIWMGVSVETDRYCFRVDHLREVPAAIRFLSAEPLLGELPSLGLDAIDWVIAGGESGANARPMYPSWVLDIRDRCLESDTAFFFKQWGAWTPREDDHSVLVSNDGSLVAEPSCTPIPGSPILMRRVSKSEAGRELDGRTWDQMPKLG